MDTILGKRESKISGWINIKIVSSRILASEAKVIILEELTSSLTNLEKKIMDALIKIKKNLKIYLVIVSHEKNY